ncbi:DUF108 domain-containing protein [Azospirillum sp. RWY-5-1]|uniref:L-aspartate dehydrogenase n=1 Tax=Azospirillum oleiclasticum TaxID=2735135 RepID=A0ABX2TE58_9PROT|nr:aspartate dehydrogenase domain-containing protein [Azospirillum oleiclasticum]NYZ13703.1 DUF108 domain-containing protein [Azospirillum oleiclasticum]NYZ20975.1 DUF108 domain-containing protein [Azospirillum oleiclasticum]
MRRDMATVGLIGRGAIGGPIIEALAAGSVPGHRLGSVLVRSPAKEYETDRLEALLAARPSLVIEAAGQDALRQHGEAVLRAGIDLLVFSIGALADAELEAVLHGAARGGGRLLLSTGAVGGLDALKALREAGAIDSVRLHSTTTCGALLRPWMDERQQAALRDATAPVPVFEGTAREACRLFPASANVSAAIALASVGLDRVTVQLVGDPQATAKRHRIEAEGADSRITMVVENRISADNPRTSRITPFAALRWLRDQAADIVVGA